ELHAPGTTIVIIIHNHDVAAAGCDAGELAPVEGGQRGRLRWDPGLFAEPGGQRLALLPRHQLIVQVRVRLRPGHRGAAAAGGAAARPGAGPGPGPPRLPGQPRQREAHWRRLSRGTHNALMTPRGRASPGRPTREFL